MLPNPLSAAGLLKRLGTEQLRAALLMQQNVLGVLMGCLALGRTAGAVSGSELSQPGKPARCSGPACVGDAAHAPGRASSTVSFCITLFVFIMPKFGLPRERD